MRQLAIGVHNFHDTMNKFPRGGEKEVFKVPRTDNNHVTGTSWIVFILPYIEQQNMYDKYRFDLSYNTTQNAAIGETVVATLYCPSGPSPTQYLDPNTNLTKCVSTHYYGVMGPGTAGTTSPHTVTYGGQNYTYTVESPGVNEAWSVHGIFGLYKDASGSKGTNRVVTMGSIIDGTSNTLMLAERSVTLPAGKNDYRTWTRGNSGGSGACKNVTHPIGAQIYTTNNFNDISFGSNHPAGCQFALGDASVRFVAENIDVNLYKVMSSMDGGENAQLP